MKPVGLLFAVLLYSTSSVTGQNQSLNECKDLLCKDDKCPTTNCFCYDFQIETNLYRFSFSCGKISVKVGFHIEMKSIFVYCTNESYHLQLLFNQIFPHFQYIQVKEIRICLLNENLIFGNNSDSPLETLQGVKFLEIKIQQGLIREQLIQYMMNNIPSLKEIRFKDTLISEPQEKVEARIRSIGFLNLYGKKLKNITKEIFAAMKEVNVIDLNTNEIETLPKDIFWNLFNVTKIDLSNNKIQILPEELFRDCKKLEELEMNNNELKYLWFNNFKYFHLIQKILIKSNNIYELEDGLFNNTRNLRELDLSSNKLTFLSSKIFQFNKKLVNINFSYNKISSIEQNAFNSLNENASIYLDNNEIKQLKLPLKLTFPPLKKLSLNNNCLQLKTESSDVSSEPSIRIVSLRNCCLSEINPMLPRITKDVLDLRNNVLNELNLTLFSYCNHMRTLDVRDNLIEKFIFNFHGINDINLSNSNTDILLGGNPAFHNCSSFTIKQFLLFRSIYSTKNTELELHYHYIKKMSPIQTFSFQCISDCPSPCQCVLISDKLMIDCSNKNLADFPINFPLPNHLLHLFLQHNNLTKFPYRNSSLYERIEMINVDNNQFNSLKHFKVRQQLRSITLHGNQLSKLDSPLKKLLKVKQNISLTLSRNPWVCDCDAVKLKNLISKNPKRVKDETLLKCKDDNNSYHNLTTISDDFCEKDLQAVILKDIAYIVISLFFSLILVFILIYRFKAVIRFWLFTRGWCLPLVSENDIDESKEFDAFISYSSANEEWVAHTLVPELENGIPSYKVCVHTRNWLAGEWIPDQIIRSVQASRRTIIVFSKEFVKSCWSRMEFHVAHLQTTSDKMHKIIIIVIGELPDISELDAEMRMYLKLNTYIKWGESHFWRKLKCTLPRIRKLPKPTIQSRTTV